MANTNVINSFSYIDFANDASTKALLKNAIGLLFYDKTTPIPLPEASHSMQKGTLKPGNIKTGA